MLLPITWIQVCLVVAIIPRAFTVPISTKALTNESGSHSDIVELSSDADSLRTLLSDGEDVEVFDDETLLLYKSDAVYQIHIPQLTVEAEEDIIDITPPDNIVKLLEATNEDRISLDLFKKLTGIEGNADEVFSDWDLNGDSYLDKFEIPSEEMSL